MQRKSDSVFGTLQKTVETANVYQKQSTTIKQNTKPQKKTTNIKNFKTPTFQKFRNLRIQKSTNLKVQKSTSPKIQNSNFFTRFRRCEMFWIFGALDFGIWDFWNLGFLDFRSGCRIAVVDTRAKFVFWRVVGWASIYVYIYIIWIDTWGIIRGPEEHANLSRSAWHASASSSRQSGTACSLPPERSKELFEVWCGMVSIV